MDRADLMGQQGILRLLIRFSVPAVFGMMVQALYNVVDRIYIGRSVGSLGIAATTVAMPIMMIGFGFALMVGIGGNALVSIRLGEQQRDKAEQVLGNAVVMMVIMSTILVSLGLIFIIPALKIFGATDTILPYARDYIRIIMLGWIVQTIGFGLNNFIRGEGNPKKAMLNMLVGSVSNIILDPIFIFGLGWGMQGAAIATVIAQFISFIFVMHYYLGGRSLLKIRVRYFRLQKDVVQGILAIGAAPFIFHIADSVVGAIINTQLKNHGGDLAISMAGVHISLIMMIFMFVIGIAQGTQPIVGYNYGAKQYDRVKRTLLLAILIATAGVTIAYIFIMSFPVQLVRLFNQKDAALIALGEHAIPIFFLMLPLIGFQVIASNFFQAIGKARQATFLVLSRTVMVQVPCILILPYFFGLDGVWMSTPTSIFISSLVTGGFLYFALKQLHEDAVPAGSASCAVTPVVQVEGKTGGKPGENRRSS
ncbi:MATE family efflux transporter [bacterium]|nr:MATE family efflux transporter [bacterium]